MTTYYSVLGLTQDANSSDIAAAYRDLAIKHHPKLSKEDFGTAYKKFCKVSEAYQVLSDKRTRDQYDRYGEYNLKLGIFNDQKLRIAYSFSGSPERIFEQFFGTSDPFAQIFDPSQKMPIGSLLGFTFNAKDYAAIADPEDLVVDVNCTLKELYNGCKKIIKYKRTVLCSDGSTTKVVDEQKEIEIQKGYNSSHQLDFAEGGNQGAGVKTSLLSFRLNEIKDKVYKRVDDDLVYNAKISLKDALSSTPITIQTLDGRQLNIAIDEVIGPNTQKIIPEEGMPIFDPEEFTIEKYGRPLQRGCLIVKFDVVIPASIDEEKKDRIIELLSQCKNIQE